MNVSYLDLNYPDLKENYSIRPNSYGGGRVFISWMREEFKDEFHIFADEECFKNINFPYNCHPLTWGERQKIRNGAPIKEVIKNAAQVDLFLHPHPEIFINLSGLKAKQATWLVGLGQYVNPNIHNILIYNDYQQPHITNPIAKIHKIIIGKPISKFRGYIKDDYIFQCSRHLPMFNSVEVAKFCLKYKIKGIFAGPIDGGYPLEHYIDNQITFYLGQIDEDKKMSLTSHARLYTLLHDWDTPMSLSAVESLSVGTPVACKKRGFWPSLIKEGENGFFINSEDDLKKAWDNAQNIDQRKCYESVAEFSVENMTNSVYNACRKILNEN